MANWTDREIVELFHLTFVRGLRSTPAGQLCTIKGGCNLRFFFGSPRYSEDIDFDVRVTSRDTLKRAVDRLLASDALAKALSASGISVASVTTPKQTDTTQRWKATLSTAARGMELHTKIEFSRRSAAGDEPQVDAIVPAITAHYGMLPLLASHYGLPAAVRQKVRALIGRSEVQARDVFDLSILLPRLGADIRDYADLRSHVPEAVARTLSLSFEDFAGQVLAYLPAEEQRRHDGRLAWEALQLQIIEALESIRS